LTIPVTKHKKVVKSEKDLQEDPFQAAITSAVLQFQNSVTQYLLLLVYKETHFY